MPEITAELANEKLRAIREIVAEFESGHITYEEYQARHVEQVVIFKAFLLGAETERTARYWRVLKGVAA